MIESLNRKVSRAVSLGLALSKLNQQSVNRIADWGLVLSVILLFAAEEHSRRTWRDRASSAQITLARNALEISALRLSAKQSGGVK